jgi:hypothetical protein
VAQGEGPEFKPQYNSNKRILNIYSVINMCQALYETFWHQA